jgi:hypothetical protein
MPRRLAFAATLAAAAVAAVPALAENPFSEQLHPTRLDTQLAKQVALKHSDLVGAFHPARVPFSSTGCRAFHPDVSSFVVTGRRSTAFQIRKRSITVLSSVNVFATELDARGDFGRITTGQGSACLSTLLSAQGMHVVSTTLSRGAGVGDASVHYNVVANARTKDGALPFYADMLVMRKGRVAVTLVTIAPLRPATGQSVILSAMASRVLPQITA